MSEYPQIWLMARMVNDVLECKYVRDGQDDVSPVFSTIQEAMLFPNQCDFKSNQEWLKSPLMDEPETITDKWQRLRFKPSPVNSRN